MDEIGVEEYGRTNSLFFSLHRNEQSFMQKEFAARKNAGCNVTFAAGMSLNSNTA